MGGLVRDQVHGRSLAAGMTLESVGRLINERHTISEEKDALSSSWQRINRSDSAMTVRVLPEPVAMTNSAFR